MCQQKSTGGHYAMQHPLSKPPSPSHPLFPLPPVALSEFPPLFPRLWFLVPSTVKESLPPPTPAIHPVFDTCQLSWPHQSAEHRSSFPFLILLTSLFPLQPSVKPSKVTKRGWLPSSHSNTTTQSEGPLTEKKFSMSPLLPLYKRWDNQIPTSSHKMDPSLYLHGLFLSVFLQDSIK